MFNRFIFYQIKKTINKIHYLYEHPFTLYLIAPRDKSLYNMKTNFITYLYANKISECYTELEKIKQIIMILKPSLNDNVLKYNMITQFIPLNIDNEDDFYQEKLRKISLISFWLKLYVK